MFLKDFRYIGLSPYYYSKGIEKHFPCKKLVNNWQKIWIWQKNFVSLHIENAAMHYAKTKNAVESANRTKETELRK